MHNFSYSIPYLLFLFYLTCIFLIELYCAKRNYSTKGIRYAIVTGFIFFFAFRGLVNTDCLSYYPFYENLKTPLDGYSISDILTWYDWEPGFIISTIFIKSITSDYYVWTFLWSIWGIFVLNFFFIKYSRYYSLSFLLFFIWGGYGIMTNLMRGSIAFFLFLISINYLYKRQILKYMLINIVGVTFHTSSLVYLFAYFILNKKLSKKVLWSIFIISNLFFIFHIGLTELFTILSNILPSDIRLVSLIQAYVSDSNRSYGLTIGYIERFLTAFIVCLFYQSIILRNKYNIIFANAYIIYMFCMNVFADVADIALRLSNLFIFSYWIIIPSLYNMINNKKCKYAFLYMIIFYSSMKIISANSYSYHEYKNILFGTESFESAQKRIDTLNFDK